MREKLFQFRKLAKEISKEKPMEALEYLEQALKIAPSDSYTLVDYGWLLKRIGDPKVFIDYCDNLEDRPLDLNIGKAYYWCIYDFYIKQYPDNDLDISQFISIAEQIVEFCKKNKHDSACINLNLTVILKVVKFISGIDDDFEKQLEWMQKIDVELLDSISDTFVAEDGNEITNSSKERYYNQMCWILYKKVISGYDEEITSNNFDEFIETAEYIVENCDQKSSDVWLGNPYVLTVLKVVKTYNKKNFKNYSKILEWISKLDPSLLSEEIFSFKDSEGKDRELASPKEFYYQHISKAYEKLRKFEECVAICDLGLEEIKKWHYKNHIWIRARRYYSNCMITDDFDEAIKEYIKLAERESHWFMFHKVSLLYLSKGRIDDALSFAAKAFTASRRFDIEKMINLIYDIGILLQAKSKNNQANIFFQACGYYRNLREWNLAEELRFIIKENNIDISKKFDVNKLRSIIKEYISPNSNLKTDERKVYIGKIHKILVNGDGFIKRKNNESLYFKVRENKGFLVEDIVNFEIGYNKDQKPIAINVKKQERA